SQAEDGIRDFHVTGVQTCALPISNEENIIFNETEYAIKIPTRFGSQWGEMQLGSWSLREDDPERYLSDPELKRLQGGSPEEKDRSEERRVGKECRSGA